MPSTATTYKYAHILNGTICSIGTIRTNQAGRFFKNLKKETLRALGLLINYVDEIIQ